MVQRNGVKYSDCENKSENFTVKLSFSFKNSVIHSYLYNNYIFIKSIVRKIEADITNVSL